MKNRVRQSPEDPALRTWDLKSKWEIRVPRQESEIAAGEVPWSHAQLMGIPCKLEDTFGPDLHPRRLRRSLFSKQAGKDFWYPTEAGGIGG